MQNPRRVIAVLAGAAAAITLSMPPATSAAAAPTRADEATHQAAFPDKIDLPTGFFPEGIVMGDGPTAYVTSLANGDVYKLDLASGNGKVFTPGPGTGAVGIARDAAGRLWVAGGSAGTAWVIDSATGETIATYQLSNGKTFVNDFVITEDAAWATDSVSQVLYKLPLGPEGALPSPADIQQVRLGGDIVFTEGWNANGIVRTPDGKGLLVVQSNTGHLYRVDPDTGDATRVDLGAGDLTDGDGMLLEGTTLYVVHNLTNAVSVVQLSPAGTKGRVVQRVTDPRFDTPTTIARFGNRLYLPNARFGHPSPATAEFNIVAIPR